MYPALIATLLLINQQNLGEDMTSFQAVVHYDDRIDVGVPVAILYYEDCHTDISEMIKSWVDRGYEPWVMFNSSQDYTGAYVNGRCDGETHYDEVQQPADGSHMTVFSEGAYMVPNPNWLKYMKDFVKGAIDAGAKAIVPEEPEFFSTAGYSPAFKEAWREQYGTAWVDPAVDDTSRWMARRLMAKLYEGHLHDVLEYAKSYDPSVKRIIAAHSPLDYAINPMVYPHVATSRLPALDGYIAQVWSDTARASFIDPTQDGATIEGVFYKAFLEYNYFWNLLRDTGKDIIYLQDPKSDSPEFSWQEYRDWYEQTVIASTLFNVTDFEVMPWPDRFFISDAPEEQKTVCLTTVRAMQDVKNYSSDYSTSYAMLVSDTLLWSSPNLPEAIVGIMGLGASLLRYGVPIDLIPVERAGEDGFLDGYEVVFMSYDAWLPESKAHQDVLVDWVKRGGILAFLGGSRYTDVRNSWWKEMNLLEPQDALFRDLGIELQTTQIQVEGGALASLDESHALIEKLGRTIVLPRCDYVYEYNASSAHAIYEAEGGSQSVIFEQDIGEGLLLFVGIPPHFLVRSKAGAGIVRGLANYLSDRANIPYQERDSISVRRGPYHIVYATQNEVALRGQFIDLLDANLPLIAKKNLSPGQYAFLYEIDPLPEEIEILYSSSIIENLQQETNRTAFQPLGTFKTVGVTTIYSPNLNPKTVSIRNSVTGVDLLVDLMWNESFRTLTIKYNLPLKRHKVQVLVEW